MPQGAVRVLRSPGREPPKVGVWVLFLSPAVCLLPGSEGRQSQEKPDCFSLNTGSPLLAGSLSLSPLPPPSPLPSLPHTLTHTPRLQRLKSRILPSFLLA